MIRRLFTLMLVLACAFAPALPALETAAKSPACDCCGTGNCCDQKDCALPPVAPGIATVPTATVESRATAARPAPTARVIRAFDISYRDHVRRMQRTPLRAEAIAPAGAPLFQAHCAFLI